MRELDPVETKFADILEQHIKPYLTGVAADLRAFAEQMAADGAEAASMGNEAIIKELGMQAQALGEVHRLRANAEGWKTVGSIVSAAFGILLADVEGIA